MRHPIPFTFMKQVFFLLLFLLNSFLHGAAQTALPVDSAFGQALVKKTRTLLGAPGVNYWQNEARYKLKIDFNPQSRLLEGTVVIDYKNNSTDTLKELWFKLYSNIYKKGVVRKTKIAKKDLGEGLVLDRVWIDGQEVSGQEEQGTNMRMPINKLPPGGTLRCTIDYHYTVNEGSHLRTGKVDDGAYFIAYFFPRIAVYDDIDGWNTYPYTGAEEFYNDFCDFQVDIRVPKDYMVWATGEWTNGKKILNKSTYKLLNAAALSDTTIDIIREEDLRLKGVTRGKAGNVFKFKAAQVVDFAFALSNHYLWKSKSVLVDSLSERRTRVDAVFKSAHKDYDEVIDFAEKTVRGMSHVFPAWPFPYSHMTVFDGLDQMEYPMMANDNPTKNREDAVTLTSHEIFHTMFPFYMGTNETKYGWMDEGWATIGEWKLSTYIDSTYTDDYGIQATALHAGSKDDQPIITLTPDLIGPNSFTNSYPKPALGYLYVEEYLGADIFRAALHDYIRIWQGKHPQPLDFFNSINAASGKNLNWFWKRWFFENGVLDLAIQQVEQVGEGHYVATIANKGKMPLPVHLTIYYLDGSSEKINLSIGIWESGNQQVEVPFQTNKPIKKIVLGDTYIPDKNKKDNVFLLNGM